ncbi:hypothetical protein BHM03_00023123 [Ensete ventricosum]|uniref:Uncharacterized protein n=1 Tax=Ensete ventricosum TaxID=4639 RepID=A0A445MGF2_ENSVE|nr:hypothetical protein BHM03_00023123 [Ensete ventricosum]
MSSSPIAVISLSHCCHPLPVEPNASVVALGSAISPKPSLAVHSSIAAASDCHILLKGCHLYCLAYHNAAFSSSNSSRTLLSRNPTIVPLPSTSPSAFYCYLLLSLLSLPSSTTCSPRSRVAFTSMMLLSTHAQQHCLYFLLPIHVALNRTLLFPFSPAPLQPRLPAFCYSYYLQSAYLADW